MTILDIILPTYNPSGEWIKRMKRQMEEIQRYFYSYDMVLRLIICTDGSWETYSDKDKKALRKLSERMQVTILKDEPNHGKGYAVRAGAAVSNANYVLYTDYDFPFRKRAYHDVLTELLMGRADIVTAERGHFYQTKLPFFRHILSKGSMLLNRLFLSLPVRDTQSGLKAFNAKGREALLATDIDTFLFDTQFIAIATRRGLTVKSVRTKVRSDLKLSGMGWHIMLRELRMFNKVLKSRWS